MNRRHFVKTTAGAALATTMIRPNFTSGRDSAFTGTSIFDKLVQANDALVPNLLQRQELRSTHKWYGGMPDAYQIHTAMGTARFIEALVCAFSSQQSTFYKNLDLVERMEIAAQYMLNAQHDDGTIDLLSTNFHSTPDTAFVLEHICAVYKILAENDTPATSRLTTDLKKFIFNAGKALTVGGIHTPNHRWVVSMALARIFSLFPNQKYIDRIDEWLNEKIDIDPDGQFNEKSTSIYSPVTVRCFMTIARLLDRPDLFEPVRKNLNMTMYYVHPDGEVVTEASRRQDQYRRGSMYRYYYPYRFMALKDNNGQYAAMARLIEKTSMQNLTRKLFHFVEEPELKKEMPVNSPLPSNYTKVFSYSNLVRIRKEDISATILAKNPTFFSFHKGTAALEAIRCAASFFGKKGQFIGEDIAFEKGQYTLKKSVQGPYYQPLPINLLPNDGDWDKMSRSLRPQSEVQTLNYKISVIENKGRFELNIDIQGTDNVPVAIELGFRHGGTFKEVEKVENINDAYFLKNRTGYYTFDNNTIEFGPGLHEHAWTQLRGSLPKLNAQSVYLTGFTPVRFTLKIS